MSSVEIMGGVTEEDQDRGIKIEWTRSLQPWELLYGHCIDLPFLSNPGNPKGTGPQNVLSPLFASILYLIRDLEWLEDGWVSLWIPGWPGSGTVHREDFLQFSHPRTFLNLQVCFGLQPFGEVLSPMEMVKESHSTSS